MAIRCNFFFIQFSYRQNFLKETDDYPPFAKTPSTLGVFMQEKFGTFVMFSQEPCKATQCILLMKKARKKCFEFGEPATSFEEEKLEFEKNFEVENYGTCPYFLNKLVRIQDSSVPVLVNGPGRVRRSLGSQ